MTLPLAVRFSPTGPAADRTPGTTAPQCLDLSGIELWEPDDIEVVHAAWSAGSRAAWRTWRDDGVTPQRRFLVWGPPLGRPDVETFTDPARLTPAQRAAIGHSALLWTAEPKPPIRLAVLYDAYDASGGPAFRPDRPVLDPAQRAAVLGYLAGGARLLVTTATMPDVFDAAVAVPLDLRTDGEWIWPDAAGHYLDRYGISPDAGLLAHAAARGHVAAPVSPVGLHRALAALQA